MLDFHHLGAQKRQLLAYIHHGCTQSHPNHQDSTYRNNISTMDIPKLDPIKCHQFDQLTPMFVVYIMWYTHGNHEATAPQSNQAT